MAARGAVVSGGGLIWLTDNELGILLEWYRGQVELPRIEDNRLNEKLEAVREEIACRATYRP